MIGSKQYVRFINTRLTLECLAYVEKWMPPVFCQENLGEAWRFTNKHKCQKCDGYKHQVRHMINYWERSSLCDLAVPQKEQRNTTNNRQRAVQEMQNGLYLQKNDSMIMESNRAYYILTDQDSKATTKCHFCCSGWTALYLPAL